MSGDFHLWCFSEAAGGHIPGQLPETTENSLTGKHNCVYSTPLPLNKGNHDSVKKKTHH